MPNLYEINTLLWLQELTQKYGKPVDLGHVPGREWDRLRKLGFDYIWLMGVWQRSRIGRKIAQQAEEMFADYEAALPGWSASDIAGSPYSIDRYQPDPRIGTPAGLLKARDQLHRRGMGLILDLVPNHTGMDFSWVKTAPGVYVTASEEEQAGEPQLFVPITRKGRTTYFAKGRDPYFPPWNDTLQLNAFSRELRKSIRLLVRRIGKYCDGLRCDMVMLSLNDVFRRTWGRYLKIPAPPTEFWFDVISANPDLVWVGEAYWDTEWTLLQLGFDYVYDKKLYDRLRCSSAAEIRQHLRADTAYQERLVRFTENHDEQRSAAVFDRRRLEASLVLLATLPGMKLYHQGQMEGHRRRIPVQLKRSEPEETDERLRDFYHKVLHISRHPVFRKGDFELIDPERASDDSFHNLIAYIWRGADKIKLVVVNFGPTWSLGRVPIPSLPGARESTTLIDELNGERYVRDSAELRNPGLLVLLDSYRSHVFDLRP